MLTLNTAPILLAFGKETKDVELMRQSFACLAQNLRQAVNVPAFDELDKDVIIQLIKESFPG